MTLYTYYLAAMYSNQMSFRSKASPAKLWELSSQGTEISPPTARFKYNYLVWYKRQMDSELQTKKSIFQAMT